MKADFSEFSYGYAVTEELVSKNQASIVAAPLFPSLYQEGQVGGGYDVKIPLVGTPVFLQFKLSDRLERTNAKEHKAGLLGVPYFRMHIRPTKHSDQHNLLLDLEASGEAVFYIAPAFNQPEELNDLYLRRVVVANSAAFSPHQIGPMPDDDEHYVVFQRGSTLAYRCSDKPVQIASQSLQDGLRSLLTATDAQSRQIGEKGLRGLTEKMLKTLEKSLQRLRPNQKPPDVLGLRRIVEDRQPSESASYIARTFFDAELAIVPTF